MRLIAADPDAGLEVPLQIQVLEAEQIPYAETKLLPDGNYIIAGVEFDPGGHRVAYHVYKNHPAESVLYHGPNDTVRVDASEILHYFKPLRPGQVRGIPECFAAQATAHNLMIYDEAELIKKQASSLVMGFIVTPDPDGIYNANKDDRDADPGEAVAKMEAGTIIPLEPGEDYTLSDPAESGSSYDSFRKGALRSIAASLNMTYEELSLDLSGVNFSSIRAGLNQSQRKYRKEQQRIINMICLPVWRKFFETAMLAGVFDFTGYADNRREFERVQFQPPGWAYVNPLQEVNAKIKEVEAGFKSREQIVAEMGYDIEEVDQSIKRDQDRAEDMGLNLSFKVNDAGLAPEPVEDDDGAANEDDTSPAPNRTQTADTADDTNKGAFNGAQVTAITSVVAQVAQGFLPYDAGRAILEIGFGVTSEEAQAMLGDPDAVVAAKAENK